MLRCVFDTWYWLASPAPRPGSLLLSLAHSPVRPAPSRQPLQVQHNRSRSFYTHRSKYITTT